MFKGIYEITFSEKNTIKKFVNIVLLFGHYLYMIKLANTPQIEMLVGLNIV